MRWLKHPLVAITGVALLLAALIYLIAFVFVNQQVRQSQAQQDIQKIAEVQSGKVETTADLSGYLEGSRQLVLAVPGLDPEKRKLPACPVFEATLLITQSGKESVEKSLTADTATPSTWLKESGLAAYLLTPAWPDVFEGFDPAVPVKITLSFNSGHEGFESLWVGYLR